MLAGSGAHNSLEELRSRVQPWVAESLSRSAELGFLGSMSIPDQISHALGFVDASDSFLTAGPAAILDLGSGGGVPGLILASCWAQSRVVLLDSNERRTKFLADEVASEGIFERVEVLCGRAEQVGRDPLFRHHFQLVTARSFGAPAVVAECGAPFLTIGGIMVVSEPPGDREGQRWPSEDLASLGLQPSTRTRFNDSYGYQVLVKVAETADRFPRRVGIPTKRPLF